MHLVARAAAPLPWHNRNDDDAPSRNRKLAAIMMADAVSFSRLVQEDERGTLTVLRDARQVIATIVSGHSGRVVDTAGDSVLAEFPSIVGAVAASIALQAELARSAQPLRFRIGIHLGDIIAEADGTVFGDAVNLAARLQSLASPGGILVSRAAYEQVRGKLPISFRSRGRYSLKNIRGSVLCFEVSPSAGSEKQVPRSSWTSLGNAAWIWHGLGVAAVAGVVAAAAACLG